MALPWAVTRRALHGAVPSSKSLLRSRGGISCALTVRHAGDYKPNDEDRAKYDLPNLVERPKENDTPAFDHLQDWLIEQGATFTEHLTIQKFPCNMRGIQAKTNAHKGETITTLPEKVLITDLMGRTLTEMGKEIFVPQNEFFISELDNPSLIATTLYILETQIDDTHMMQAYYQALPTPSNFLIHWPDLILETLKGSHLPNLLAQRKATLQKEYWLLRELSPTFAATVVFDDFCDARLITASRGFGIVMDGEERHVMLPFIDVANHLQPTDASLDFDDQERCLELTADRPITAGQQVMLSYGSMCNSELLLQYGFVVEGPNRDANNKPQNKLVFDLEVSDADPLAELKRNIINTFSNAPENKIVPYQLSMDCESDDTRILFSSLRIIAATQDELDLIPSTLEYMKMTDTVGKVPFLTRRNEAAALKVLNQVMKTRMDGYNQTLEENLALRDYAQDSIKLFSSRRAALLVVLGEQQICEFWMRAFETEAGPILSNTDLKTPLAYQEALEDFEESDDEDDVDANEDFRSYRQSIMYTPDEAIEWDEEDE